MSLLDRMQRREFLLQGSAVTAAGLAAITSVQAEDKNPGRDKLSPKMLEKFVGEEFTIVKESKEHGRLTATFVLQEVKSHKHSSDRRRPTNVRQEGFSIMFAPRTGSKLEDGIYQVQHDKLGTHTLFLGKTIRSDQKKDRVHFVAVFN